LRSAEKRFDLVVARLPWEGATAWQTLRLDAARNLEPADAGRAAGAEVRIPLALEAPAVAVVRLERAKPDTAPQP
jgi:hypothetical protein